MATPFVVQLVQGDNPPMQAAVSADAPAGPEGPPGPVDLSPGMQIKTKGGEDGPIKNDDFYKAWDRFTKKKRLASGVPTLETDVEGRPGRPVETDKDGVVVRR
jgi:hypothetical protein